MKKIKPPKGWIISECETSKMYHPEIGIHNPMALCFGYDCVFVKRISKTKKSRPKKPLYAVIYDAIAGRELCNAWPTLDKQTKRPYIRAANAASREIRRRMANK